MSTRSDREQRARDAVVDAAMQWNRAKCTKSRWGKSLFSPPAPASPQSRRRRNAVSDKWISVNDALPKCPRGPRCFGVPVLIWPRNPGLPRIDAEGFAYFGRRVSREPSFYLYGTQLHGVTHWMPLPAGPKKEKRRVR